MKKLTRAKLIALLATTLVMAFAGCKSNGAGGGGDYENENENENPPTGKKVKVYTAGWEDNNGPNVAKVWKNGSVLYTLTDGSHNAVTDAIALSDSDVYTAGYEDTTNIGGTWAAKIWKNGALLYALTTGSPEGPAYAIALGQ